MENRATLRRSGAVADLRDVLGPWVEGSGPLFRKLARAIGSGIERGALTHEQRLPSERDLANALAIGRGTAVAAYDVLVADGLVERRHGSGTYVAVTDQPRLPAGREGSALVHRLVERSDATSEVVDLSLSVLRDAHGLPDVAVTSRDLTHVEPDTGYTPWGLPSLRRLIAQHVTDWGVASTEHQIVITTGAQQAISAAAACWVRPGDRVVVEDPTYPGALAAFVQAGAEVIGAPMDSFGVRVAPLAELLEMRPALVYLQSGVHSPTGTVLSAGRREQIARLVADARVPLLEDVALNDLAWQAIPPPIASLTHDASVALVGSLSKVLWGGLRIGFVRAPAPLALRFARVKATNDLGSSAVSQLIAERVLATRSLDDIGRQRTRELRSRYDALATSLATHLPAWTWPAPAGGLSIWVKAPGGDSERFAEHALRHGVAVATPGALSPSDRHGDRLRLSFAGPASELEEGVRRLAAAWRTWTR